MSYDTPAPGTSGSGNPAQKPGTTSDKPLFSFEQVASICDHTNLSLKATPKDISNLCAEAKQYGTASVCVRPEYVRQAVRELQGTDVAVCEVVGFPFDIHPQVKPGSAYFPNGYPSTQDKVLETLAATAAGATEIDVVANNALLLEGRLQDYQRDLYSVIAAAHAQGAKVKVIFENCFLPKELKVAAYNAALVAGADYLKTATGFGTYGATEEDLALMKEVAGDHAGIKAAGSVNLKNYETMILTMLG